MTDWYYIIGYMVLLKIYVSLLYNQAGISLRVHLLLHMFNPYANTRMDA